VEGSIGCGMITMSSLSNKTRAEHGGKQVIEFPTSLSASEAAAACRLQHERKETGGAGQGMETVSSIRPCRFDLSVCITCSGQKKSLENIKKKEKLISTASTAFKCLYGLYKLL
jgi:hypothetical protein